MHNLDDFGGWCRGEMRQWLSPAGKHTFSFVVLNIETAGAVTPPSRYTVTRTTWIRTPT